MTGVISTINVNGNDYVVRDPNAVSIGIKQSLTLEQQTTVLDNLGISLANVEVSRGIAEALDDYIRKHNIPSSYFPDES